MASAAATYPALVPLHDENPREATGELVCANSHCAQEYIDPRLPHEVLLGAIFEATAKQTVEGMASAVLPASSMASTAASY